MTARYTRKGLGLGRYKIHNFITMVILLLVGIEEEPKVLYLFSNPVLGK
jgi:hypothetical protein